MRKLYAMQRMSAALNRASAARPFGPETDRALRWAAAWGMSAGIRTPHTRVRLRRDTLVGVAAPGTVASRQARGWGQAD